MPLVAGDSKAAFSANVAELIRSGRKRSVALAIAFRLKREKAKKRAG